jgi:predicted GNAT family N-acyltransferase
VIRAAVTVEPQLLAAAAELHAQVPAIGFYQRLGYATVGEPYDEAGIAHRTMRKQLLLD